MLREVEPDVIGAVGVHPVEDRRRDLVARRELVGEPVAGGVEQRRALAADRLGDQRAVVRLARELERGRVELAELEVGELGAGGVGEHRAGADRAARVRRPRPERGAAARSRGSSPRRRPRRGRW